ncbi:Hsp20 family protein [Candidatus Pantoea carbekii]|uniref:Hsp20 family protein n=1 Tax=Candidatus Pantoea carbekii TaxID=1235990 RepID=UPI0006187C38|nr:Hsp20 family protein [Candidatus Pantoea carbekii]AKC32611.1 small heat shock protein ibpB [Candidatus Pantoea carbekii]
MSSFTLPVFSSLTDSIFSDRFNRIDRLFSQLTGDTPVSSTPTYDLRQLDNEHYALTVSVPGWKEHELEIEDAGGRLTVTGRKQMMDNNNNEESEENNAGWLHKGINRTDFRLSYNIPEYMKVTEARLEDGLLNVKLYLEIPESEKPRRIPIKNKKNDAIEHQSSQK